MDGETRWLMFFEWVETTKEWNHVKAQSTSQKEILVETETSHALEISRRKSFNGVTSPGTNKLLWK